MPELEPQTGARKSGGAADAADELGPDPLASLHKMSTTAGVGSQDYVAVNTLAVTTAVLGLATAFAFIGSIFLLVAAATIVCGVIAIRQINDSNGTQGGKWLAIAGMVVALLIAGVVASARFAEVRRERSVARQVTAALDQFGKLIVAGEYEKAYELTDPAFRDYVTAEQWVQTWKAQQAAEFNGRLTYMRGNNVVNASVQDGINYAYTHALVGFERRPEVRATMIFSHDGQGGQWKVNRIIGMFHQQLAARGVNTQTSTPLVRISR